MENKVYLSVDLVNGILNYLGQRPFVEVAGLINKIQEEAGPQVPQAEEDRKSTRLNSSH